MIDNKYEGVLKKQEVKLIKKWAKQAKAQPHEIPDVLQDVVMAILRCPDGWPRATSARRKQLLWVITRNTLGKIRRTEERQRRRDEQKALTAEEAYIDHTSAMRLDVQEVLAGFDDQCRAVCELLSQEVPKSQIAERLNCDWREVDGLVRTIRQRFEETGVNQWLQ